MSLAILNIYLFIHVCDMRERNNRSRKTLLFRLNSQWIYFLPSVQQKWFDCCCVCVTLWERKDRNYCIQQRHRSLSFRRQFFPPFQGHFSFLFHFKSGNSYHHTNKWSAKWLARKSSLDCRQAKSDWMCLNSIWQTWRKICRVIVFIDSHSKKSGRKLFNF